jgi:hypothetical protein
VRAKAVLPLRARNKLHHPKREFESRSREGKHLSVALAVRSARASFTPPTFGFGSPNSSDPKCCRDQPALLAGGHGWSLAQALARAPKCGTVHTVRSVKTYFGRIG